MKNPIYVKVNIDVYEFFKSQKTMIHNIPEDFIGTNGCYLYSEKEAKRKTVSLEGHHLVVATHEGIFDANVWLKVRKKCLGNKQVAKHIKARNTSGCNVDEITDYMSKWDELEVPDKMAVVDVLISVIRATQDTLEIEWKI